MDGAGNARVVPPDTNIVMVDLPDGRAAGPVVKACAAEGVLVSAWSATRIRAVTHLDASAEQVRTAAGVLARALAAA